MVAEIDPRRHRHTGLFQEIPGQPLAVVTETAAVSIKIERTGRDRRNFEPESAQSRQQEITAAGELGAASFRCKAPASSSATECLQRVMSRAVFVVTVALVGATYA